MCLTNIQYKVYTSEKLCLQLEPISVVNVNMFTVLKEGFVPRHENTVWMQKIYKRVYEVKYSI